MIHSKNLIAHRMLLLLILVTEKSNNMAKQTVKYNTQVNLPLGIHVLKLYQHLMSSKQYLKSNKSKQVNQMFLNKVVKETTLKVN